MGKCNRRKTEKRKLLSETCGRKGKWKITPPWKLPPFLHRPENSPPPPIFLFNKFIYLFLCLCFLNNNFFNVDECWMPVLHGNIPQWKFTSVLYMFFIRGCCSFPWERLIFPRSQIEIFSRMYLHCGLGAYRTYIYIWDFFVVSNVLMNILILIISVSIFKYAFK